jgi:hypothetical protein
VFSAIKYTRIPCYIWKAALSPHKFTHPPSCRNWIRTFRNYGIKLPFSGITLQQDIANTSELLLDLWYMDRRPYSATWHPCLKSSPFLIPICLNCSACKTRFSALLAAFQGAHPSENCIRLSIFRTSMIILQNYAGNKQKLYKIMKMQMSAILGKAKPDTENIRGLNLAAVKRTTVQVSRLLL